MSSPGRSLKLRSITFSRSAAYIRQISSQFYQEDTKTQPRKGAPGCMAIYLFDFGAFSFRLSGQRQELRLEEGGEAAHVSGDWEEGGEEDVSQGKLWKSSVAV